MGVVLHVVGGEPQATRVAGAAVQGVREDGCDLRINLLRGGANRFNGVDWYVRVVRQLAVGGVVLCMCDCTPNSRDSPLAWHWRLHGRLLCPTG